MAKPKTSKSKKVETKKPNTPKSAEEIAAIEERAGRSVFDLSKQDKEALFADQSRKGALRIFDPRDVEAVVEKDEVSGENINLDLKASCIRSADPVDTLQAFAGLVGAQSSEFAWAIMSQACNIGSPGQQPDERGLNFVLGVVKGVQPRDQLEAMLAVQMAAVHLATIDRGRRMLICEDERRHEYEKAFNRLSRTFAAQMEALKKYRSDGRQTVRVERVNVEAGGQAVVGDVHHGGEGGASKNVG